LPTTCPPDATKTWRIPRRRVSVRIELTDGTPLSGSLYADAKTASGAPGRVADRLNDAAEAFVPLAVEHRHVLLRKSGVALIRLRDDSDERSRPRERDQTELKLRMTMTNGATVQGCVRARLPRQRTRALDFLNLNSQVFVEMIGGDGHLTLINSDHIARVIEVIEI